MTDPVHTALQERFVLDIVTDKAAGWVTVAVAVVEQPLLSVTVTV